MLELINTPGYESVSVPSEFAIKYVDQKLAQLGTINYAELGVGVGATALAVSERIRNKGEVHLFDFGHQLGGLLQDLRDRGFTNIHAHTNTNRHWDSYHWSLSKLIRSGKVEHFDVIYLDGAHTYLHDALAFFMCDRLLKVGGLIIFDDWYWAFVNSQWMKNTRQEYMTDEQAEALQIKMLIEELVDTHVGYEVVEKLTVYRKIASTTRAGRPVFRPEPDRAKTPE